MRRLRWDCCLIVNGFEKNFHQCRGRAPLTLGNLRDAIGEFVFLAMNDQQTFFTLGREQKQFDLAGLDEVDHLVLVAAGVNIRMPRDRYSGEFSVQCCNESRSCGLNSWA
jgi:hypothetical protein